MNSPTAVNLFLVGPMGAGKTSVGNHLAKTLNLPFLDSDREIESRTGVSIPIIFDIEGEAGFRRREEEMIEQLTAQQGIVLATGGGAVLSACNRQNLTSRGTVFYLKADIQQLYERTRHDRNRPLLQTDNPERRIAELIAEREPLYLEVADHVINTDRRNIQFVTNEILRYLGLS